MRVKSADETLTRRIDDQFFVTNAGQEGDVKNIDNVTAQQNKHTMQMF